MTTASAQPGPRTLPDPGARAALRGELLKLRSVPSAGVMLAVAIALCVPLSLLHAHGQALVGAIDAPAGPGAAGASPAKVFAARVDPTGTMLSGYIAGAALFAAFGSIAGALEYSSGMIRISLAVVPRRTRFFLCKAAAVAAVAGAAAGACTLGCFLIGESFFRGRPRLSAGLTSPGVPMHLAGAVVCLTGWAMIGFAFGMLLRSTALGVSLSFAFYIAAPLVADTIDPTRANVITPAQTGEALWTYHSVLNPQIAPFPLALTVFLAYTVALLAAAFARVSLADA